MVPGYARQRVTYGELIGGRHFHHKLEWNKRYGNPAGGERRREPKAPSEYKVVGKSFPQKVITEKVMGREQYITDVRVEGMLHARVIRPPNAGCNPVAVDEGSIKGIPGARVVREKDFLAVVADARMGRRARRGGAQGHVVRRVRAVPADGPSSTSTSARRKPNGERRAGQPRRRGGGVRKSAARRHRRIRMAAAIARQHGPGLRDRRHGERRAAAVDGLAEAALRPRRLRDADRAAAGKGARARGSSGPVRTGATTPATRRSTPRCISKLTGRTVRLQYMRHDGTAWDPKGPAAVFRGRAGLDAAGNVVAYHFHGKGFSRQDVIQLEAHPKDTLAGQLTGFAAQGGADLPGSRGALRVREQALVLGNDTGAARPRLAAAHRAPARSAGGGDALCERVVHRRGRAAAGADPVAFRLRYLKDPRAVAAVKAAAEKASWQARAQPESREGRRHDRPRLLLHRAQRHRRRDGGRSRGGARERPRVGKEFWVAHDCGQIINPGSLQNVIEGNVVQAVSRTLLRGGQVQREPRAERGLGDLSHPRAGRRAGIGRGRAHQPAGDAAAPGAGEPSTRTVPAAIANAIFDATGVRMRRVPITPERMKAALARA